MNWPVLLPLVTVSLYELQTGGDTITVLVDNKLVVTVNGAWSVVVTAVVSKVVGTV